MAGGPLFLSPPGVERMFTCLKGPFCLHLPKVTSPVTPGDQQIPCKSDAPPAAGASLRLAAAHQPTLGLLPGLAGEPSFWCLNRSFPRQSLPGAVRLFFWDPRFVVCLRQSRDGSPREDKPVSLCAREFTQPRGRAEVRVSSPRPRKRSRDAPDGEAERA